MAQVIAYLRVSTSQQGESGLGLGAQREAIHQYARAGNHVIIEEFVEVDSGGNNNRVKLHQALQLCKLTRATLVMKTLDRLSRDVSFIADLMKSDIDFVITDMPDANKLTLHLFAAIAEWERETIGSRTKAALQRAKDRGPVFCEKRMRMTYPLGIAGPRNLNSEAKARGRASAARVATENSILFAKRIEPILQDCKNKQMNLTQIAQRLTELQVKTARGKTTWYPSMVSNCLKTLERM